MASSVKEKSNGFFKKIDIKLQSYGIPAFLRNKFVLIGIFTLLIIFIYFITPSVENNVPTFEVKKGNFLVSLTESGELEAKNSKTVSAPRVHRGGLKIIYLIPEGTYVDSGTVVMKFDPTQATQNLKDAESKLEITISDRNKMIANHKSATASMEMTLKTQELSYELSKLNLEQMKFEAEAKRKEAELNHKKNELSYKRIKKDSESKKIIRQSELSKMEIQLKQVKKKVEKAKKDLASLTVLSPAEGLVVYQKNWSNNGRKFTVGDQPWGGASIITLPDLSIMESRTSVNEVDISKVKVGQKVKVKLDAFQDTTFQGEVNSVARLGKKAGSKSDVKVFEVTILLKGNAKILRPGMTTSNQIIMDEIPDQIYIPFEALFQDGGSFFVYLKSGGGFDKTEVEVGTKSQDYIVIKKGIEAGDKVALRDPTISLEEERIDENSAVSMPNSEK